MTPEFKKLLTSRRVLLEETRKLNAKVREVSNGRPHHQACDIGGLQTGMSADFSGSPCWCGGTGALQRDRVIDEIQSALPQPLQVKFLTLLEQLEP